ncbi:MAG TPA: dihydrolipoamide acetyltransferase family protein [Solirubrobacterales bacterium]|nr:dihydrolipoamide acetyltransferase family protein [Solirubrobacterales bacterium]
MPEIVMPRLSDSMEEGTVIKWLKEVGDEIAIGEEIVEIETDKANMAYEADVAGTLTEILAQEGDTLPIGEPIAVVGDEGKGPSGQSAGPVGAGDPPPPPVAKASSGEVPPTPPPAEGSVETPAAPTAEAGARVKASPVAKRLAKEKGVDLSQVAGSGPGGRIVKKDVKKAVAGGDAGIPPSTQQEEGGIPASPVSAPSSPAPSEAPETAKGQVTVEELTKLQQVVARRMSESKATAPHFYLETVIDMSRAVEARGKLKAIAGEDEVVPSYNDMVVKACALGLKEFPRANGSYKDGRFELYSRVNVGVAVAAQDALVVPTVFDADKKGLRQIATDARALAGKVRDGSITPPQLSGGTFTVSNLGMFGVTNFSAVINSPQAGILAVGAIEEKPVVRDGEITTAHLMEVTLACDHRILYGADGAQFLARVKALLEEPLALAL